MDHHNGHCGSRPVCANKGTCNPLGSPSPKSPQAPLFLPSDFHTAPKKFDPRLDPSRMCPPDSEGLLNKEKDAGAYSGGASTGMGEYTSNSGGSSNYHCFPFELPDSPRPNSDDKPPSLHKLEDDGQFKLPLFVDNMKRSLVDIERDEDAAGVAPSAIPGFPAALATALQSGQLSLNQVRNIDKP